MPLCVKKQHDFLNALAGLKGYALGLYKDKIITDQNYQAIVGFIRRITDCTEMMSNDNSDGQGP